MFVNHDLDADGKLDKAEQKQLMQELQGLTVFSCTNTETFQSTHLRFRIRRCHKVRATICPVPHADQAGAALAVVMAASRRRSSMCKRVELVCSFV